MDAMSEALLAREEAALEKRLRRLEADVRMIAAGGTGSARLAKAHSSADYLGSLVDDVAAAHRLDYRNLARIVTYHLLDRVLVRIRILQ